MIRQIIWDFDGVIIFSDTIREEGFREVLKGYGAAAVDNSWFFIERMEDCPAMSSSGIF